MDGISLLEEDQIGQILAKITEQELKLVTLSRLATAARSIRSPAYDRYLLSELCTFGNGLRNRGGLTFKSILTLICSVLCFQKTLE